MARFHDVDWPGSGGDGDTKAEQEASAHKLVNASVVNGGASDDCSHDDQKAADEHASSPTPGVDTGPNEGQGRDTANLVHCRDEARPDTVVGAVEEAKECLVGSETTEQRPVKAVHCLAEEAKQRAEKQEECSRIQEARPLRDERLIVGTAPFDNLDLCDVGLRFQVSPKCEHINGQE